MKIEEFHGELPLARMERELVGRQVEVELFALDLCPDHLKTSEERFRERYPSRQPEESEVRDFAGLSYTAILEVWNKGNAGLEPRPTEGVEDLLNPAFRIACSQTTIKAFNKTSIPHGNVAMTMVEVESTENVGFSFPLQNPLGREALYVTITENTITHRREYAIRFYGMALILTVPL